MPRQHRAFYAQLPYVFVGGVDSDGHPWASILTGHSGFIGTPDDRRVVIDAVPLTGCPLANSLKPGAGLGLLGIDLDTKRRNRLSARIDEAKFGRLLLTVLQSFGNCAKYINPRSLQHVRVAGDTAASSPSRFTELNSVTRSLVERADTCFVASSTQSHPSRSTEGADVSHRGGQPGFIKVEGDLLTVPDYAGNRFFNTLGNFTANSRAGLLFIDFERGDVLMLTGDVRILWEGPRVDALPGAERAWQFRIKRGLFMQQALALRWNP